MPLAEVGAAPNLIGGRKALAQSTPGSTREASSSCRFGMDSAAMPVYAIDQTKGELNPIGHYRMGTQPNWIEIVDLK